jgi:ligand-binding sensor domain-containing protein
MMRNYILTLSFLWLSIHALAQSDIPVGSWRTHNSYNSLVTIANGPVSIYAASSNALFIYNPATQEIEVISSLSGLSDTDITTIDYNTETEKLVIGYQNGNIDIISNNQITNFPELLNAELSGSKKIHQIYNYQQESYLSTDFGVMIIDLEKLQVKETFFELGPQGQKIIVYNAVIDSDSLYLATEIGVMRGSLQDNLKDFNQWQYFDNSNGIPNSITKVLLPSTTGLIAAVDNAGVFVYDGNVWQNTNLLTQSAFNHGSQEANNILLTTADTVYRYAPGSALPIATSIAKTPQAAIFNGGNVWVADAKNGLVNTDEEIAIYPNGPFSEGIVNLYAYENIIIAMPPAYDNNFQPLRNIDGFFKFEDGSWENFNSTGYPKTTVIPNFLDVTGAAYSPIDQSLNLSSFGYGILKIRDQATSIIDESNSFLINLSPPGRFVLVSAITAGNNELSVLNFSTLQPLHVYNFQNDTWKVLSPAVPSANVTQIIDVGNSVFWMKVARAFGGGIKVYDAANSRELYLSTSDNSLPANEVYDLALDREGKMWVATKKGVVYFHQAANIFDTGRIDPVFPIFDGRILFKDEKISALAIDGGNRVWMGTTVGLWLFDNDGQEEVLHFMANTDPLPSDDILNIAINQNNGEVFIATAKGLISYRGTSTAAGKQEEVKIFPNPVILSQNDIVTIEGVPENAYLKITDAAGRLVYQTQAHGNTATWQGLSGSQSLSSGVYFVFISSADGSDKQVGKIAIVN